MNTDTKQGVMIGGVFTPFDQRKPAPNKAQHSTDLVGSPHESPDTTRRQAGGTGAPQWCNEAVESIRDELLRTKEQRDDYKAYADKLAEALREAIHEYGVLTDSAVEYRRTDWEETLAAYEAAQ